MAELDKLAAEVSATQPGSGESDTAVAEDGTVDGTDATDAAFSQAAADVGRPTNTFFADIGQDSVGTPSMDALGQAEGTLSADTSAAGQHGAPDAKSKDDASCEACDGPALEDPDPGIGDRSRASSSGAMRVPSGAHGSPAFVVGCSSQLPSLHGVLDDRPWPSDMGAGSDPPACGPVALQGLMPRLLGDGLSNADAVLLRTGQDVHAHLQMMAPGLATRSQPDMPVRSSGSGEDLNQQKALDHHACIYRSEITRRIWGVQLHPMHADALLTAKPNVMHIQPLVSVDKPAPLLNDPTIALRCLLSDAEAKSARVALQQSHGQPQQADPANAAVSGDGGRGDAAMSGKDETGYAALSRGQADSPLKSAPPMNGLASVGKQLRVHEHAAVHSVWQMQAREQHAAETVWQALCLQDSCLGTSPAAFNHAENVTAVGDTSMREQARAVWSALVENGDSGLPLLARRRLTSEESGKSVKMPLPNSVAAPPGGGSAGGSLFGLRRSASQARVTLNRLSSEQLKLRELAKVQQAREAVSWLFRKRTLFQQCLRQRREALCVLHTRAAAHSGRWSATKNSWARLEALPKENQEEAKAEFVASVLSCVPETFKEAKAMCALLIAHSQARFVHENCSALAAQRCGSTFV
jgi:hypothetical protein